MFQNAVSPNQLTQILAKIHAIQTDLHRFSFRSKFYQLTHSNVFNFDIHKVINDRNSGIVGKLCSCFFYFLVLKMMIRIYEENYGIAMVGNRDASSEPKKTHLVRTNSIESELSRPVFRTIKNRASTTVDFIPDSQSRIPLTSNTIISQENSQKQQEFTCIPLMLVRASQQLNQSYLELTESFTNKHRVQKIQIICFLIALISPDVLHPIVEAAERQIIGGSGTDLRKNGSWSDKNQSSQEDSSCIQEEVYIVLTYQTLGSFVSPNVFKCLKKRYVKQTIFNVDGDKGYYKLVKSLKHIKQRLTQKDVIMIKGRKQRAMELEKLKRKGSLKIQDQSLLSMDKMKLFIKESLKTKQEIDYASVKNINRKQQDELQQLNHKIQQSFYPSALNDKPMPKVAISRQSPISKYSVSMKNKINKQNFKARKTEQVKLRKYICNSQKTFYKFRNNGDSDKSKVVTSKNIKSERSSHKFSKIPLESCKQNIKPFILKTKGDTQPMQHMKKRLKLFKEEALKDLKAIELFKPMKISSQRQQIIYAQQRIHKHSFSKLQRTYNSYTASQKRPPLTKQSQNKPKKFNIRLPLNEKQQVWHEMYNLKADTHQPVAKLVTTPQFEYKLAKKSDKLRKDKEVFMGRCKERADFLEEDIDLAERLRMKIK